MRRGPEVHLEEDEGRKYPMLNNRALDALKTE
jgi:hypothetical protein